MVKALLRREHFKDQTFAVTWKKTYLIVGSLQASPTSIPYGGCGLTMQKPHVLQWLALCGLQMLQVEQYLDKIGHHHRMQLRSDLWGGCIQGHMPRGEAQVI